MTLISGVPVIDIKNINDEKGGRQTIVKQIANACKEWGFFQVINHNVSDESIRDLNKSMKEFFMLSDSEKSKVKRTEDNSKGWFNNELTKQKKDWKEGIDIAFLDIDLGKGEGQNQWPEIPLNFKANVQKYTQEVNLLSHALFRCMVEGLEIEVGGKSDIFTEGNLSKCFEKHTSFARLNYYPYCDQPIHAADIDDVHPDADAVDDGWLSVHQHTDAGVLTVLLQRTCDPSSLQVKHDGVWSKVVPVEKAFTINVGDMMQIWSNDVYKAPLHRVLANSTAERYSVPYFYNPAFHTDVMPLVSIANKICPDKNSNTKKNVPRYETLNWGKYRLKRFEGDFRDAGKEIQISDYLIPNI